MDWSVRQGLEGMAEDISLYIGIWGWVQISFSLDSWSSGHDEYIFLLFEPDATSMKYVLGKDGH